MPDGDNAVVRVVADTFVQGWGFFTRDPTEERSVIYVQDETKSDKWVKDSLDSPSIIEVNLGFSRSRRAYLADIALILETASAKGAEFTKCKASDGELESICDVESQPVEISLEQKPVRSDWCGHDLMIVKYRPIPFNYGKITSVKQGQSLKVKINCE